MLPAQTRPVRRHCLALLDAVRAPRSRHTSRLGASDMSRATRTGVTAPRGACVAALSPRAPGRVACKINYFLLGSTAMHPWVLATTWPSLGSGGKRPCIWSAGVYTAPRATRGAGVAPTALRSPAEPPALSFWPPEPVCVVFSILARGDSGPSRPIPTRSQSQGRVLHGRALHSPEP